MKNYYYILPSWQNNPLCIILVSNKELKKAMKNFPECDYSPCPFTKEDELNFHVQEF